MNNKLNWKKMGLIGLKLALIVMTFILIASSLCKINIKVNKIIKVSNKLKGEISKLSMLPNFEQLQLATIEIKVDKTGGAGVIFKQNNT